MTFGSGDVLQVYGFLKTYNMLVTNMKVYVTLDPDDDADFRYTYGDTMIAQFKQDLYNKNFSLKIKVKVTTLILSRIELYFGLILLIWGVQYLIIFMIMIITTKDWIVLFGAEIFPETRELKKTIGCSQIWMTQKTIKLL